MTRTRIAVLASGGGTNLQAILDHLEALGSRRRGEVVVVGSDRAAAGALERARARQIPTELVAVPGAATRSRLDEVLSRHDVELVVLAGYLRHVPESVVRRYAGRMINVHPALLPAFPGLHAVQQALEYGVKVFGVTVHFVDGGVDTGPVILQRAIELPDAHTEAEVLDRLHPIEHELLPAAVRLIARGAVRVEGRQVVVQSS